MNIIIREYEVKDFDQILPLADRFEDYLIALDDMGRLKREEGFAEKYLTLTLQEIEEKGGKFYVACDGEKIIGGVIGVHEENSPQLTVEQGERKCGRVTELYLEEEYRGQKIGKMLMEKIENFFRENNYDDIVLEVLKPNTNAHEFYKAQGYKDRAIEMLKELKK